MKRYFFGNLHVYVSLALHTHTHTLLLRAVPLERALFACRLELLDCLLVLPANLRAQLVEAHRLVFELQVRHLDCVRDHHLLHLIVRRRDSLVALEALHRALSTLRLVRDHAAHGAPRHARGCALVERSVSRLRVGAKAAVARPLHLLAHESTRHVDELAPHEHNLLAEQKLLGDDRGEPTEKVSCTVNDANRLFIF